MRINDSRRPRAVEPLSYSISECTDMGLGSRATIYTKIHGGGLTAFKDGTRTRITADSAKRHHSDLVSRSQGIGPPICRTKAPSVKQPPKFASPGNQARPAVPKAEV